ncbi:MAG TPA: SDR family oxidoreductase [Candidatus Elarobacter sp.]|nr:SDR family oxidoreductase [Candidatus Elarobacter sp.]
MNVPGPARVAIVAGASGGIGSATVRAFLRERMNVVLAAPRDALLDALERELAPYGERVLVVPTDITRRADVDALIARALVRFRRIDVLANVAGVGSSPSLYDCTDEEIERVLAVNLLGAARTIHAVLPVMKAQRSGSIVNVGSVAGEAAVMGIYSASKFGLRGLNDSVRREVRGDGIGVTLIEPGFVQTPMNAAMSGLPGPEIVADAIVAAVSRPRRSHIVPAGYRIPVFLVKTFPFAADLVFGNTRIQQRLNRDARAAREKMKP